MKSLEDLLSKLGGPLPPADGRELLALAEQHLRAELGQWLHGCIKPLEVKYLAEVESCKAELATAQEALRVFEAEAEAELVAASQVVTRFHRVDPAAVSVERRQPEGRVRSCQQGLRYASNKLHRIRAILALLEQGKGPQPADVQNVVEKVLLRLDHK